MSYPVHIERHAAGPRCWIFGQRVHHGATGCALVALGMKRRAILATGLVLVLHDRHDWRAWFTRSKIPRTGD